MSKIKFQHYVPRFYLEAYTDSNGMVWVFDKLTRRIFSTKPENIAGENYFYDVPQIESPSELNQALEKAFSIHEDEASKIIAYLDGAVFQDDFQPLDQNNRQTLATYIALQIMRVPKYREFLRKFINHVPDEISRDIKKFVDEDERIINLLIFDNETSINNYAKMLADQIWVFARNTTDSPFYTSDNPVLFKTKDNKFWTPPVEPITHGVEIVFPLSPDVILYVMEKTYF